LPQLAIAVKTLYLTSLLSGRAAVEYAGKDGGEEERRRANIAVQLVCGNAHASHE